jgi:hypothetical protein
MKEIRSNSKFRSENRKEDLNVDGNILKCILKKEGGMMQIGFISLRTGNGSKF